MKQLSLLLFSLLFSLLTTAQVKTIQSGLWTNPQTWSNGEVPQKTDDVIISAGHQIILDTMNKNNYTVVPLCSDLTVEDEAFLSIGHNVSNRTNKVKVFGDLFVDGVIYKGVDENNTPFLYNTRIEVEVQKHPQVITGNGAINAHSIKIYANSANRKLNIDHHYINIDNDFFIKSVDKLVVNFLRSSYLNVKGTFGLNGQSYTYSEDNTSSEVSTEGIMMLGNLSFLTKNENPEENSKFIVKNDGFVTVGKINNEDTSLKNAAATSHLVVKDGSTFRLKEGASNPRDLNDENFLITVMTGATIRPFYKETQLEVNDILDQVEAKRPSKGYVVDESFKEVYGATFTGGLYHFTDEPYMREGKEKHKELGSKTLKSKVSAEPGNMQKSYPFNMQWDGSDDLVDVVKDSNYQELLSDPFYKEHVLWISPKKQRIKNVVFYKYGAYTYNQLYKEQEEQYYLLAKYILETYGDTDKKFLFQNWEGDWMLRGQGVNWEGDTSTIPENVDEQIEGMIRFFQARQRGVERAREEFPNATAQVLHGIEINKLWTRVDDVRLTMMDLDVPSLTENILPHVRTDFNSWSSYDGVWTEALDEFPVGMWKGVEILEYYTNATGLIVDESPIMIGEFGINEMQINKQVANLKTVEEMYDKVIACAIAQKWNNFFIWSLYSTDTKSFNFEKGVEYPAEMFYQYSDGKWVVEPDGTFGVCGMYFQEILAPKVNKAIQSGNWSEDTTWENEVPTKDDFVVIPSNIEVVVDTSNLNSNTNLVIAKRLKVEENATLKIGHDASFDKILKIDGDIFVDGNIHKGAEFSKNARIYQKLPLIHNQMAGIGEIKALTIKYFDANYDTCYLNIDQSYIETDQNYLFKSEKKVIADVSENSTIKVNNHFGITGSSLNWLSANAQGEVNLYGSLDAKNSNLITLNNDVNKSSRLTIKDGGEFSTNTINQEDTEVRNGNATFTFEVENAGVFNLTSTVLTPSMVALYDLNFIYNEASNSRLRNEIQIETNPLKVFVEETSHQLSIQNPENKEVSIQIYDLHGRMLFQKENLSQSAKIDLNSLKGIYIIRYLCDNNVKSFKTLL